MADLVISIDIDASGTKKGAAEARNAIKSIANTDLKALGNQLKNVGAMMESFGGKLRSLGTSLTAAITAPIAAIGYSIIKAGSQYESALNYFQAVTKATGDEMKRAAQVAKDLGADLSLPATSAKDAALAMTELGKAGLTAAQAMDAAKGVLQLAAAGQIDEARAAEIAANALNAFKLEASETTRVADLLAAAANASSAEVDDIALAMQQASAVFAGAKIPIEDLTAAISLMANAGVKGSDAGTSLKVFVQRLTAPTDNAADAMKKLGVAVFDAAGNMKPLPDIIGQFDRALTGLTDEQKAQALYQIFGTDALRAAQILFREGEAGFNKMKEAVTAQGAAADLANAKMKGLAGAWEGFKSQLETVGITIYESIKAPLTTVLQQAAVIVGQFGDAFAQLSPQIQLGIVAIAAMAAAAGPLLVILGSVISAVGTLVSVIGGLVGSASVIGIVAAAIIGLGVQVAPVVAIAAAWYAAWQTNFGGIRDLVGQVVEFIKAVWSDMSAKVTELTSELMGQLKTFWEQNGTDIMAAVKTVSDFIKSIWTEIMALWARYGDQIKAYTTVMWENLKVIVKAGLDAILQIVRLVTAIINGDWSKAWDALKGIVRDVLIEIAVIVKALGDTVVAAVRFIFDRIWDLGSWVLEKGKELGINLIQGIITGIGSMGGPLGSAAARIINLAIDKMRSTADVQSPSRVTHELGKFITMGLVTGMQEGEPIVINTAVSIAQRVIEGFKRIGISDLKGFLQNAFDILTDSGKSFGQKMKDIFGGIVKNFQQMIRDMLVSWLSSKLFGAGGNGGSGNGGGGLNLGGLFGGNAGGGIFNLGGSGSSSGGSGGNSSGGGFSETFGGGLRGTITGIGAIGTVVGGAIGGRVGSFISNISTGAALGAQIGSIIPGVGTAIGAVIGAAGGFLASLFGGDPKKKKDKKENLPALQKGFQEAIADLERLKNDRLAIYNDPDGTLARARDIRTQIAPGFGIEFLSKKYRKIAQQQIAQKVAEADRLIAELEQVAGTYKYAHQIDERLVTSFAGGVYMSSAFVKQFSEFKRRNGFLGGRYTGVDTLPSMLGPGEMVLNPYQVARVKANAGMDPFARAGIPGYASGVSVQASSPISAASFAPSVIVQPKIEITIEGEGITDARIKKVVVDGVRDPDVQVEIVKAYDRGKTRKPRSY